MNRITLNYLRGDNILGPKSSFSLSGIIRTGSMGLISARIIKAPLLNSVTKVHKKLHYVIFWGVQQNSYIKRVGSMTKS